MTDRSSGLVAALQDRYGFAARRSVVLGEVPTTRTVRPMGPLVEIAARRLRDGVVETWRFAPMPRLCFGARDKRLWCLGGDFRFDGRGFHARAGRSDGLRFLPVDAARRRAELRGQLQEFRRTHAGLDPEEAAEGTLSLPRALVALAHMEHCVYRTDRNDGDGRSEWIHKFEDEHLPGVKRHSQPLLCTAPDGRGLWFAGGTYSVLDGWLAG